MGREAAESSGASPFNLSIYNAFEDTVSGAIGHSPPWHTSTFAYAQISAPQGGKPSPSYLFAAVRACWP